MKERTQAAGLMWVLLAYLQALMGETASVPMEQLRSALKIASWTSENECGWPGVACSFSGQVQGISLVDQTLSAPLPTGIFSQLPSLQWVILVFSTWNDDFKTAIPKDICTGNLIFELSFANFKLDSTFPSEVFECTHLTTLNLARTKLEGPIPDLFAALPRLERVELYENSLSGEIPLSLARLQALKVVELQANQLEKTLPAFASDSLQVLDVRYNSLTGPVDVSFTQPSFARKPNIQYIGVEFNKLTLPQQCQGVHFCYISLSV
jgi:hypothetical protein